MINKEARRYTDIGPINCSTFRLICETVTNGNGVNEFELPQAFTVLSILMMMMMTICLRALCTYRQVQAEQWLRRLVSSFGTQHNLLQSIEQRDYYGPSSPLDITPFSSNIGLVAAAGYSEADQPASSLCRPGAGGIDSRVYQTHMHSLLCVQSTYL